MAILMQRMGSRAPAGRWLLGAVLAAAAAAGSYAGCYNPDIQNGGFTCAGTQCPEGFVCNAGDHRCYRPGTAPDGGMCQPVQPLCQGQPPAGEPCSPVCQTGCECGRCNVQGMHAICTTAGTKILGQLCSPTADDCAPGLICLLEACGNNLGRCFRHCTSADQCGGSGVRCEIPIQNGNGVDTGFGACDLAPQVCDPILRTGCPNAALTCYLTEAGLTFCDCPNPDRTATEGQSCNGFNDCVAGLICASQGSGGSSCRALCRPGTTTCTGNNRCVANGSSGYGVCIPN